ncbi:Two-component system-Sensor histidine kinase [Croceitalea dokdonensis DOKDO 023]|uniref:Two-component system-Sensor histidine kinase n=1 Tax=Croceitalea dokdonensis DOKDO 023 TaxID=1300341 RepID=A0A0P7A883_9FLAO|nr:2TM domain-containing protein [Croceitalea dokdonensis]KPM33106.1 Two-component system-Sensor histidine kinase [Croceitalea dokdonensis DOKDO 023]
MENTNEYQYNRAKEHVELIKSFYVHVIIYSITIGFLAYLNYRTTSFVWVIFPALGWGLGLASHGLRAFGQNLLWGKSWEERKIKQFMEEDRL